ncbi:hypothetical protein ACN26Y_28440 [Micromonospora sp. WMMD558]|uniref:hypothetical protein n=1 Tax=Micromonospora sp. WMMD558 TaxID=3403462 RepID=UPI003BF505C7
MNQVPPARPEDILAAVDRTPYGEVLRDQSRRRQLVYEAMMSGPDPIGREIAQQLRSGSVTPRDLLAVADYREFFSRARADAERLDLDALAASASALDHDELPTGDLDRDTVTGVGYRPRAEDEGERQEDWWR